VVEAQVFIEHIQRRSRRMAFSFSETSGISTDDLLQEIGLRLWQKWHLVANAADPERYALVVARHHLINLYRSQRAEKRGGRRRPVSLFQPLHAGSDLALIDVLSSK
jgi:DNA-directed RNA polymerase specialized sigma24 family protein